MDGNTKQDKMLDEQYPIQGCRELWMKVEFGKDKDDEKAKVLLVYFFQLIISRFKHFVEKLADPEEWKDGLLIGRVEDDLKQIKDNTKEVFKRKSEVSRWGDDWNDFFTQTIKLFEGDDFKTLQFHSFIISGIISRNEIKLKKEGLVDASDFKRLLGIYDVFKDFSNEYESFIQKLEAKIKPVQSKIKKVEIDLVDQLFSRLKDETA